MRPARAGGATVRQFYRLGSVLTAAASADAETIARAFLQEHRELLGLESTTVFALPLEHRYESPEAGLVHLAFRQRHSGIGVFGGDVLAHVNRDGSLLGVDSGAAGWVAPGLSVSPRLSAAEAVTAAARLLAPDATPRARIVSPASDAERKTLLAVSAFRDPVPARLVWFPKDGEAALAWELSLHLDAVRWYSAVVDANTGDLLFSHNLYRDDKPRGLVLRAADVAHPNRGGQSLENFTGWPAAAGDCPASIYPAQFRSGQSQNQCWVAQKETIGNNVEACRDADGNNRCDFRMFDAQSHFEFTFPDSYAATGNAAPDSNAAVVNLFYWNNVLHDWLYGLGFDEAAGNFQDDNFARGGFGGDRVLADAQDGAGFNNANFATPPDGSSPRMQIFLFTDNGTYLRRDAAFDGDIITHEYIHGLTLRLVGGPGSTNDLPRWQSGALGEGWSDAYASSFTNDPVVGEYVSRTPSTGIRSVAYNNSPHTFGRFGTLYRRSIGPLGLLIDLPQTHRDGEIWATVLWDLRGALGKTVLEQLLTTALKLTPSRPSMLDARNAILQAAQSMGVGGAGQCGVWSVFAARGLGASAVLNRVQTGQANDTALSVYEAFDLSVSCGGSPPASGAALLLDDMESGPNGWTATGLWHQSARRASSGVRSWWYGQEATGNYSTGARNSGTLTSPPISLAGVTRAILQWDQLLLAEGFNRSYSLGPSLADPYLNFDSGWVQVSIDGGASWDTLTTLAHNSEGVTFDPHKVNLSRFAGSTIQVRFLFDTLDEQSNLGEGWYVDNVRVHRLLTGVPALSVTPAQLSFSALAGAAALPAQSLTVSNQDLGVMSWTATAASSGWLSVSPASGSGNATLTVTALAGGLSPGTYNGTVTMAAPGATGSPAVVTVTLNLTGPIAEWRFDETGAGGGLSVTDTSGNGHHGATRGYGSAAFQGVVGNARALNGWTDWVETAASSAFSPASFSFRTWAKLLSYPTDSGWGVLAAHYDGNYRGWYVGAHASGRVIFSAASLPSSAPWLLSNSALELERWYCITTTYDASAKLAAIYINGALDAQAVFPGFTPPSAQPLTIGRASWFNGYFLHAVMDEGRLYPVRLEPAQVVADYQGFPPPPPPPANKNLVAEWRMDEAGAALNDSSGNARHGTVYGAAVTGGVLNGARSFNGSGNHASAAASDAYGPASFTLRVWVKLLSYPEAAGFGVALSNYGGNYQGWYLGVHSSGRVIFSAASLPASSPWLVSAKSLALNRWHHLAAVYNGALRLAIIYIDGVADAQTTLPGFTPAPFNPVYLGRASWIDGYYFHAALDEVRVYPVARSAAEILSDYQSFPTAPPPPPSPPVAEWRMDDPGDVLTDASGNGRHGSAQGTVSVTGVRQASRSLNGVSDWVQVAASPALNPPSFSLRAWIKLLTYPAGGWGAILGDYGGNYQGWYLGVHSSGRLIFSVASLPSNSPWLLSNSSLALNTWYHVTATYDGLTQAGTIYRNGVSDAQAVFPGFSGQAPADLFMGRASWYDGYYLNAVLDEVRLLDYRLAPPEVLADYQSYP